MITKTRGGRLPTAADPDRVSSYEVSTCPPGGECAVRRLLAYRVRVGQDIFREDNDEHDARAFATLEEALAFSVNTWGARHPTMLVQFENQVDQVQVIHELDLLSGLGYFLKR